MYSIRQTKEDTITFRYKLDQEYRRSNVKRMLESYNKIMF